MAVAFPSLVSSSLHRFLPPSALKTCFLFLYWSVWRYRLSLIPAGYIIDCQHEDDYGLNLRGKKSFFTTYYVFGPVSSTIWLVHHCVVETKSLHFQHCGICTNLIRKLNSFYMMSSCGFSVTYYAQDKPFRLCQLHFFQTCTNECPWKSAHTRC